MDRNSGLFRPRGVRPATIEPATWDVEQQTEIQTRPATLRIVAVREGLPLFVA